MSPAKRRTRPVIHPAVEGEKAVLRFRLTCGHPAAQLDGVVDALLDIRRQLQ